MAKSESRIAQPRTQRWTSTRRLVPWSASIILHLAFLPFLLPVHETQASKSIAPAHAPTPLRLLSAKQAQRLLKKPEELKKPKLKPQPPQQLPKAPVVSLSRITEEVAQRQARYLATVNNRTLRETRSRQSGLPSPAGAGKKAQKRRRLKQVATQRKPNPSRTKLTESERGHLSAHSAERKSPSAEQQQKTLQQITSLDRILHQAASKRHERYIPNGTPESLDEVPEGDETILNTRAYKHGWFFNRVIGALYQNWKVQEAHRRNDPSGRVYGIRDRHTVIYAILDRQGGLIQVTVAKSSGAPHLDDEAVAAFRRAQPFPNPPAELVNEKGHIEFPMGFNLRLGEPEFFRLR